MLNVTKESVRKEGLWKNLLVPEPLGAPSGGKTGSAQVQGKLQKKVWMSGSLGKFPDGFISAGRALPYHLLQDPTLQLRRKLRLIGEGR